MKVTDLQADPKRAIETLIEYILYLNIIFFAIGFFVVYERLSAMMFLAVNILLLLLRQGIKREVKKINAWGKPIKENKNTADQITALEK